MTAKAPRTLAACLLLVASVHCGGRASADHEAKTPPPSPSPTYPISAQGGTPATGPHRRYNHCERIWCLEHKENFFIDHFLDSHVGYILHDGEVGDVYVPKGRTVGPSFPMARQTGLLLCGVHVHPWILGKNGGSPVRHTGYNFTLGYDREHFRRFGTRLDPCCVNGLGSGFVHSVAGKLFHFQDLAEYRAHPEMGWQKPFAARARVERR